MQFFSGGGEMGELTRAKDWSKTSIGSPEEWPQSLRTTISILLSSRFPMFLWWGPDLIQFYNDAYRPSLGNNGKHPAALGQRGEECWPEIWPTIRPLIDQVFAGGESIWFEDALIPIYRNGKLEDVYWTFSYSPVNDESGSVAGVLVVCTETTDKVEVKKKIVDSEERVRLAVDAAMLGTFDLNMVTDSIITSKRFLEIFGLKESSEWHTTFVNAIHPDDLSVRNEANERARATGFLIYEIRIIRPDKSTRWINVQAKVFFDADKKPSRMLGVVNDITEQRTLLHAIETGEKKFRSNVMQAPVGIVILRGPEFIVEMANESYLQLVDKTQEDFTGKPLFESLPEVKETVETLLQGVLNTGTPYYGTELQVALKRQGETEKVYFNFVYQPLRDADSFVSGIMVVATEVTSLVKTKHTLEESERQFRNLVTHSPIAMTIFRGKDWIIEIANKEVLNIWQRELHEVQGKKLLDVFPELKEQQFPQRLKEVFETGIRYHENEAVAYVNTQSGSKKYYLDFEYAPLYETDDVISGIMVTVNNVTDKIEARQQIKDAAERLTLATDGTQLATWELNLKTNAFDYSDRYKEIMGFQGENNPPYAEFVKQLHPDDLAVREQAFKDAYRTGMLYHVIRVIWNDKTVHWVEGRGKVFFDEKGEPLKMIGTARDITEEKSYQQRIEESEQRFRSVADTAPVLIWMSKPDKLRNFFNKGWLTFRGRTMEEEMGKGWIEGIHPDDLQRCVDLYTSSFDQRKEFWIEYRLRRYDGEYRWISDNGVPRFTTDDQFEGYIGGCMDIHERILFEEKLKESESRLRIAALSSELGTWSYDPFTKILSWDNATREMYWVDQDTPVTVELFWEKVHPDDRDQALQKMLRALNPDIADTYDAEYRIIGFPDKLKWIHAKGKAFFNENKEPYIFSGTVLDITDKRIALEELQENEQKFRLLADSMPQLIWIADEKGSLNYFNQSVYNYSGLTLEFIKEDGWFLLIHSNEQGENLRRWRNAVQTGEPFLVEHRLRKYDGEFRWHMSRAIPQKDVQGKIQMWVGTSTDIHDRKVFTEELENEVEQRTKELKKLNDDLVKSNIELGQFAYVASHDLQEPLRKIQTFATRVLDSESENLTDKGKDYFGRMQGASKRMQQLIVDLLSYSRANTAEKYFEVTDLNKILLDVKEQLKETIEQKHAVIRASKLPSINIIPYQFEQLLTNILSNSLKFSKPDIDPVIEITSTIIPGRDVDHLLIDPALMYHHIVINDNGIGFDQQFSDRIFQVFQRLHSRDEYAGTGIGLAIVKKIVENHKGIVTAQSELGKGVTFDIYIPVS